ncbi:hypothetical protein EVAR_80882_1 [Eumeta japonica]|uniref:Uncharacterized protein n=1 Tax=Eumeta variegata TaxID=151549 RepID=A0A4C1V1E0_EUMVA|nr:hypothetical protein EVAR_80882_1 [Eumeta japonica]
MGPKLRTRLGQSTSMQSARIGIEAKPELRLTSIYTKGEGINSTSMLAELRALAMQSRSADGRTLTMGQDAAASHRRPPPGDFTSTVSPSIGGYYKHPPVQCTTADIHKP